MLHTILGVAQITTCILITIAILLQAQGSGFGTTWAGGGETYHTRRGVEKVVFAFTIVGIIIFTILSIALLLIR